MTGRRRTANGRFTRDHPNEWDDATLAELKAIDPGKPAAEPDWQSELDQAYVNYAIAEQAAINTRTAATDAAWDAYWHAQHANYAAYDTAVTGIRRRRDQTVTPPAQD